MKPEEFIQMINSFLPQITETHLPLPFRNLGLDSLAMIQIRVLIEKELGFVIPHKKWFRFSSFNDVINHINLTIR